MDEDVKLALIEQCLVRLRKLMQKPHTGVRRRLCRREGEGMLRDSILRRRKVRLSAEERAFRLSVDIEKGNRDVSFGALRDDRSVQNIIPGNQEMRDRIERIARRLPHALLPDKQRLPADADVSGISPDRNPGNQYSNPPLMRDSSVSRHFPQKYLRLRSRSSKLFGQYMMQAGFSQCSRP